VKFARVRADALQEAVDQALTDPALRAAAEGISVSFARAGGPVAAVDALEALL
jgi:UDP:flavonoid glycosyltransferase YjiC (YdhE family)